MVAGPTSQPALRDFTAIDERLAATFGDAVHENCVEGGDLQCCASMRACRVAFENCLIVACFEDYAS